MRLKLFLLFLVFVLVVGIVLGQNNRFDNTPSFDRAVLQSSNSFEASGIVNADRLDPSFNFLGSSLGAAGERQRGVIIKLKQMPLLERRNELIRQRSAISGINLDASVAAGLNSQVQTIALEHVNFRQKAAGVLGRQITTGSTNALRTDAVTSQTIPVLGEYSKVFNGIALDINAEEAQRLKSLPEVAEIYPNTQVKAVLSESVPLIGANQVWQLDRDGNNCVSSGKECLTGKGVDIAIIDTGVDYTHPDLGGCFGVNCKVVGGYDFGNNDPDPMDDNGHGTHVAATAAGNGALKGVAPDAKIYAYKVLGSGGSGTSDAVISGIERAVDPNNDGDFSDHVDVISMSIGSPNGNPDDPRSQAVDGAVSAGVVVVVAGGNAGNAGERTIYSPGTARKAITVGASNKQDVMASFSSKGPVEWNGKIIIKPDVAAPGVGICAAQFDSWQVNGQRCVDDRHVFASGTSMATPHVSGVAALLKQENPDWTPEEIKFALRNTGKNLGYAVNIQGYGRVQALEAIKLTQAPTIANVETSGIIKTNTINIVGTAKGRVEVFDHYELYYGGVSNNQWNLICRGNTQINSGVLCSAFGAQSLNDGDYYLRLLVYGKNGKVSEDRNMIEINRIDITNPLNNDILRAGEIINLVGTIPGSLLNYKVEFKKTTESIWKNSGIALSNGGTLPVNNGVFATWDTSQAGGKGFYDLRLAVSYQNGIAEELVKNVYLDPSLKKGWPQRVDWEPDPLDLDPIEGSYFWPGFLLPVTYDLNNDGKKEIVVYRAGNPPKIFVYKYDGSLLWTKNVGTKVVIGTGVPPLVIGDIDNDGFGEIIAYNYNFEDPKLVAFNHDGSILWSVAVVNDFMPTFLIADLDFDGKKEIVAKGNDHFPEKVTILNNDGTVRKQWSTMDINWLSEVMSSPAVGNFDDDPELEIVHANPSERADSTHEGKIYVFNLDGSIVPGWPVYVKDVIFSSPAVGDINKDGKQDIVVGALALDVNSGGVYAFDRNGRVLPGWPVEVGKGFWESPSLGDSNNDGFLEVGEGYGLKTFLINYDGSIISGWPKETGTNNIQSYIRGDVTNDGRADHFRYGGHIGHCLVSNICDGVYGWDLNGNAILDFPKVVETGAWPSMLLDDLDNDGKVDLVATSSSNFDFENSKLKFRGSIYVWELPVVYNKDKMPWPMFMHDPQHTGCYDCVKPTTAVCGNGIKEGTEQCDSGDNNGVCPKTCSATCTINSCGPVCGDKICQSPETPLTCYQDCTKIPTGTDIIPGSPNLIPLSVVEKQKFGVTVPIKIKPYVAGNLNLGEMQILLQKKNTCTGARCAPWGTVGSCTTRVLMLNGVVKNNYCSFSGQLAGYYRVVATADNKKEVTETIETNNQVIREFSISKYKPLVGKAIWAILMKQFGVG